MSNTLDALINRAKQEIDSGDINVAKEILLPLVGQKNPAAMLLYATVSADLNESNEEFEARSISLIQEAAGLGYEPAIYELAVCYMQGDRIHQAPELASSLFQSLAENGYSRAKLDHGLDLYYGSNGIQKDQQRGLDFIRQAVMEKIDEAKDVLAALDNPARI